MRNDILDQAIKIRNDMDKAGGMLTDEQALICVRLYKPYEVGKAYVSGEFFTYGVNGVGDPQLYKVVQDHTSQEEWMPNLTPALYTAIGLDDSGYPVWARPTGAHDAYNIGDIVNYNGALYESTIDGNVYSPEEYPGGWKEVEAK